eukprot:364452-Chlamydomonas_euryale.AAC.6
MRLRAMRPTCVMRHGRCARCGRRTGCVCMGMRRMPGVRPTGCLAAKNHQHAFVSNRTFKYIQDTRFAVSACQTPHTHTPRHHHHCRSARCLQPPPPTHTHAHKHRCSLALALETRTMITCIPPP